MKSSAFLIIEILLTIFIVFFFLNNITLDFRVDLNSFIVEDIFASLISINYLNLSSKEELSDKICSIMDALVSEYSLFINNNLVCGNDNENYYNSIKTFYVVNGEILYVDIKLK
ncbi:MAG: hypothetical protein QW648_03510 [Nanoarchaeales archaeon]